MRRKRKLQGPHQIRLNREEIACDGGRHRNSEQHCRIERLKKNVLPKASDRRIWLGSGCSDRKRALGEFRKHAPVRQAIAPGFSVVTIVGDSPEIQWRLVLNSSPDGLRQLYPHHDAGVLFHRTDGSQIDELRKARGAQTLPRGCVERSPLRFVEWRKITAG